MNLIAECARRRILEQSGPLRQSPASKKQRRPLRSGVFVGKARSIEGQLTVSFIVVVCVVLAVSVPVPVMVTV
jgi:hypothetical protein